MQANHFKKGAVKRAYLLDGFYYGNTPPLFIAIEKSLGRGIWKTIIFFLSFSIIMDIGSILKYVVILFPISEVALLMFKRSKERSSAKGDRGSLRLLWFTVIASIGLTIFLQWYPLAAFQLSRSIIRVIALCLLIGGFIIRWISIISLGKYFTVNVAIQEEHILFVRGMYKYVRHPSYTGLLIEFIGLAVYFGTWVNLIIIVIPITGAMIYRIRCEEIVLVEKFGKQYKEYMAHTKSLIPRIVWVSKYAVVA